LKGRWVPPDIRDQIVDFICYWTPRGELPVNRLLRWIGLGRGKFATWKARDGRVNEHNAWIPRDFWLQDWEKQAIIDFYQAHPQDGYRRITYRMLDANLVAVSPASVYRVLQKAGLLRTWAPKPSTKGRGFHQPEGPHQHWHVDIAYLNVAGTFFFLCSVLDGFSRVIVHWEIRPQMTEADVEIILQRAREAFPAVRPRIISDNGPQFIARDFKEFIPAFRLKLSRILFSLSVAHPPIQFVRNLCASFFWSPRRIQARKHVVGIEPIVVDLCPVPGFASDKLSRRLGGEIQDVALEPRHAVSREVNVKIA
jgi:transposase InsO family protein